MSAQARPRVIYLSYDGAAEPLGRSQVIAYLERLARAYDIALISFEKPGDERAELAAELASKGIEWLPLRYHWRPPVLSTAFDVLAGRRALIRAARRRPPAVVHVRSYVPALIALLAPRASSGRLVFDIRGFWADERVEGGLWRPGGLLYRVAKRCERWFFAKADVIVTQTEASLPRVRALTGERSVEVRVIPNCVDLTRFGARPARTGGPHAVWIGSVGTWYRFELAVRVATALALPLTVRTRQVELARRLLAGRPASVHSVSPQDVPAELFAGDVGLCLISSGISKLASSPTRFPEYLSAGMPVLVTPGVGDLDAIVEHNGVGVVLRSEDQRAIDDAAAQLRALAADSQVRERCRRVAQERFDVERGAKLYAAVYQGLIEGRASRTIRSPGPVSPGGRGL